ncbi:MAG: hypothetical protein WC760_06400 [Bacteroidia bacterium]|jgi:hypothetical protein
MDLADLTNPGTSTPRAGLPRYAYIAKIDDILTLQAPSAAPATLAERVNIATAHVMKTGKKFIQFYCAPNKGMIETKSVGDQKFVAADTEVKLFYPGDDATTRGLLELLQNEDLIGLVPNKNDDLILQIGDKHSPAFVKSFRLTWGGKSGDEWGMEITFSYDGYSPRVYDAVIPVEPGA